MGSREGEDGKSSDAVAFQVGIAMIKTVTIGYDKSILEARDIKQLARS